MIRSAAGYNAPLSRWCNLRLLMLHHDFTRSYFFFILPKLSHLKSFDYFMGSTKQSKYRRTMWRIFRKGRKERDWKFWFMVIVVLNVVFWAVSLLVSYLMK